MPAIVAALIIGTVVGVAPRVPAAVDWVRVEMGNKVPVYELGETASLPSNAYHPALDLRAGTPVQTAITAGKLAHGAQLLAVPIWVKNNADRDLSLPLRRKVTVVDSIGMAHTFAPKVTGVEAGQLLPGPVKVAVGQEVSGFVPVSIPAGRTVAEVRMDLGGEERDKLVWKAP